MEPSDGFFRTLIALDNGAKIYETVEGKIVCRREVRRETTELAQRAMLARGNVAFAPKLRTMRPAWAFPVGTEFHRVVEFRNEPESDPVDGLAVLNTGELIDRETARIYLG